MHIWFIGTSYGAYGDTWIVMTDILVNDRSLDHSLEILHRIHEFFWNMFYFSGVIEAHHIPWTPQAGSGTMSAWLGKRNMIGCLAP